jgi:gephyrin
LLDKRTGGLTHALTQHSLGKTPLAALSRLVTGIRHRSTSSSSSSKECALILALPGSSKAVQECCEVLLSNDDLLEHALDLLSGGDGKVKHREMQLNGTETDTGKAHHHHHHNHSHHAPKPRTQQNETSKEYKTHDPAMSITTRHRSSPYPIIPMQEALDIIIRESHVNEAVDLPVTSALRGYILAQDVKAPRALPPRPTTNVDGYALRAADCPPGPYKVVTKESEYEGKGVFRINTGQALPKDADAVIMVEDTDLLEQDDNEEKVIQVKAQIDVGENVRKAGSDVTEGQLVLSTGTRIGELGGEIGTLAFLGYSSVKVYRKPKIAILSTGNELYDVAGSSQDNARDAWGFRVFDSNRPSLSAALQSAGYEVVDLGITGDNVNDTLGKLNRGVEDADVILSTGGTSMGESDLLKPLMERGLRDGKVHFGRVAMKPGKVSSGRLIEGAICLTFF